MLAHRITSLRRKAGMSQIQLAEALTISASAIGMYEQGRRTPNLDVLVAMARVFRVSLDYLITGHEYISDGEPANNSAESVPCPCATCFWKEYVNR